MNLENRTNIGFDQIIFIEKQKEDSILLQVV